MGLHTNFRKASLLCVLFFSVVSFADPFGNVNITLTGAPGPLASNPSIGSFYTGPYQFNDGQNTFLTMCFDAPHEISFGAGYNTNKYNLESVIAGNGPGNGTIEFQGFVNPNHPRLNYIQIYEAEAYLADFLFHNYGGQAGIDAQFAGWDLFDPNDGWNTGSAVTSIETAAVNSVGYLGANFYSRFVIYSPTGSYGQGQLQELPGPAPQVPPSTPEPGSLVLFASGLMGLGTMVRRRLKTSAWRDRSL